MPKIVFIEANGKQHVVEGRTGESLMLAATSHMVPGILADCGGCCSCATCHAYIEPPWSALIPPPSSDESCMLDGALHTRETSRLTCQVQMSPALDGIVVQLPETQF